MRALHVVPSYLPAWRYGGPIRSVHGLCRGLARHGIDVHVFTTDIDGDKSLDVPLGRPVDLDGVKVWYFPTRVLRRLTYSRAMRRSLREQVGDFDILHLHSVFLWPTWAAAREGERRGVPYLVAPRGMLVPELIRRKSPWLKRGWIRLIERRSLRRAAAIHVTSQSEAEYLNRCVLGAAPTVLIPNGLDPPDDMILGTSGDSTGPRDAPKIVYLGRINWKKGLDRLIPAMVHVPEADLVIAGNDEENYTPGLIRLVGDLGLEGRVRFIGPVRDEAKWALLRGATLLALPSYGENFGMVVLESMAVGTPVAVSPEVGLADTVRDSRSGIVVDGDPPTFGSAIQRLLEDQAGLETMGRNAYRTVRESFTWESIAATAKQVYERIVDDGGRHV